MSKFDKPNYFLRLRRNRVRVPLDARLFALRRGVGSKIGRHVTEPMLARLLGCTVSHYQCMERGKHPFKDKHLQKLAAYYGVSFEELAQLREVEQRLMKAGFPSNDPRPHLRSALEYAEGFMPT